MKKIRVKILGKIVILIGTILVLAMGTNTVVNIVQFEKNYRYALQTKVIAVGENLENMLQNTLSLGFPLGNLPGLNEKCKNIVGQYTEIADCYITNTDMEVIYHNNSSFIGKILRGKQKALRETSIRFIFWGGEKFYEICVPILHQKSELLGTIRLAVPVEFIQSKTRRVLLNSVFLLIASSIVAFLGAFYFARGITRPLKSLADGARAISSGDFDYPLKVESKDEVGQLSESFGRMALNLRQREDEIRESKEYLENLLETANDLIYTVDINGCFTYINPRIENYGYTPGELMGKSFLTTLTEKHRGK
ncbi:MAG: HAMP domain-containing protein, partial [Proteobacteria bacterium]|nr:HAMP domain-containing protein [Pseudomonadota bacterium]